MYLRLFWTRALICFSPAVELRQAIVAMMNRKDELEEQNMYVELHQDILFTFQLSFII